MYSSLPCRQDLSVSGNRPVVRTIYVIRVLAQIAHDLQVKQADELENILAKKFLRFLSMRAESFQVLRRKPVQVQFCLSMISKRSMHNWLFYVDQFSRIWLACRCLFKWCMKLFFVYKFLLSQISCLAGWIISKLEIGQCWYKRPIICTPAGIWHKLFGHEFSLWRYVQA